MPSIDLFNDAFGLGRPDKGLGFAVVLAEVPVNCRREVDQRAEDAALRRVSEAKKVLTALAQEQAVGVK